MTANTAIDPAAGLNDDALSDKKKNLLAPLLSKLKCAVPRWPL